jgi:hypothetical protein
MRDRIFKCRQSLIREEIFEKFYDSVEEMVDHSFNLPYLKKILMATEKSLDENDPGLFDTVERYR